MRTNYYYTVNGEVINTMREINALIRHMNEKPDVIKYETWSNGKISQRKIQVKGNILNGNLTIL